MSKSRGWNEFRLAWHIVLGAAMGVGLGVSGLLTYSMGLFADALRADIGLSRTAYGAGFFGSTIMLALALPIVGRAVDRYGSLITATGGALALSLGFMALSYVGSVAAYLAAMLAIGFFAAPSSPVAYTRAVAGAFRSARGLAIGLTQVGIGIAAAVVPPMVAGRIAADGWRSGFAFLSALAAGGILAAMVGLRGKDAPDVKSSPAESERAFAAIRSSRAFILQLAAFSTMALAFAGMLSHFVPMLREGGVPLEQAGALAGMIGLSVIVTRVVVGWLSDRVEPARLGALSCAVCAAGCLLMAIGGPEMALVGAIALGAAMGAEADLIGILTARYFSLPAYSRAYARQYAAFMIAGGISPLWIGALADLTGNYRVPLLLCAAGLLVPVLLFMRLARMQTIQSGGRR